MMMTNLVSLFSGQSVCRCAELQTSMLCGMGLCVHADVRLAVYCCKRKGRDESGMAESVVVEMCGGRTATRPAQAEVLSSILYCVCLGVS